MGAVPHWRLLALPVKANMVLDQQVKDRRLLCCS